MRKWVPACWLSLFSVVAAQSSGVPPTPDEVKSARQILIDPKQEISKLAQFIFGKNGGNRLFYLPTHDEPATPATWGFKYEDVQFDSRDGTRLHGWFLPARGKVDKGTIVFSHGNAGSMGHHLGFVMWLVEAGYDVFTYDYRGFGKSAGQVDRRGMLDDVQAAFAYVSERPGVDPHRIISFGHSLGGAKSITALAEKHIPGLRAVIVDGAFASYKSMALIVGGQIGANIVSDDWAPENFISKIAPVPLLVVHGDQDEVVPVSQGLRLFELAHEPKTLFEVKDGHHGDSLLRDDGAYRQRLLDWLAKVMDG
ncbi:alpha/beta hydrolase [Luteolibacter pohnpeiensis]|uniref:Alpha/beta hydrolase n=1 Tax=Luteolibacter pohnpeiensis TaxID=454153 RepID=A0A934SBJ7_9BACT|nr:alpha/beta hydrolase [Luteolibacter pohnpeiensis]MBK1882894.1 alpha/beta hydrolase [Luteolibacter pohnpeiensis]